MQQRPVRVTTHCPEVYPLFAQVMSRYVPFALAFTLSVLVTGCPTIDLGEAPIDPGSCRPDPVYFEDTFYPMYIEAGGADSCIGDGGCHDATNAGSSAFQLEPITDPNRPNAFDDAYFATTVFLNCGSPDISPMLTRPLSGRDVHGGGDLFDPGSAQEQVFLNWFAGP